MIARTIAMVRTLPDMPRIHTFFRRRLALLLACVVLGPAAHADTGNASADVATAFADGLSAFKAEVAERHGFSSRALDLWFADVELQQPILDAISAPAERVRPWHEYRQIFLTDRRIEGGVVFWEEHADTLEQVSAEYGVPAEMIVAIIGVETMYGRITGRWRVLDALATLAFAYPPRAPFFRSELEHFLLLAEEERLEPRAALGSYAGAMGPPQFIPSSYRAYAVDGSGNGRRDLFRDWEDVLASVANYFSVHGWRDGEPVAQPARVDDDWSGVHPANRLDLDNTVAGLQSAGYRFDSTRDDDTPAMMVRLDGTDGDELWVAYHNFHVITRYNRSVMYALAAWQLSQAIAERRAEGRTAARGS